jgi:hypothetical protein
MHLPSCKKCSDGFDIVAELRAIVVKQLDVTKAAMRPADAVDAVYIGQNNNSAPSPYIMQLQKLEEELHRVDSCVDDLREFRGHIGRHLSECEFASQRLENLGCDEAEVTSDFKMKILACFFRENQKKWFGKRGTSMLGFMIATNSTDPEAKAQGIKDVTFVMMLTDDSLQDEWAVTCAKAYVYQYELPAHITKAHFVSDGAGCFKSKLHRCLQPFWKHWTGIDEISLRVTPAGDGKSSLDGMFGRTNSVLHSSADSGNSYYNADTIKEAVGLSDGLSATKFLVYGPDRSNQVKAELAGIDCRMILTTLLDPNRADNDNTSLAYKHSGYGKGILIDPTRQATFLFGTLAKDAAPIHGVYTETVSLFSYLALIAYRRRHAHSLSSIITSGRNRH